MSGTDEIRTTVLAAFTRPPSTYEDSAGKVHDEPRYSCEARQIDAIIDGEVVATIYRVISTAAGGLTGMVVEIAKSTNPITAIEVAARRCGFELNAERPRSETV